MSRTTRRTNRFKVPRHAQKRKGVFDAPGRSSKPRLPWESGTKDARSPNADAWSADSAASAKRLECVRFIGALRPARGGRRFMVPMHVRKAEGAFHEPPGCCPGISRSGPPEGGTPYRWHDPDGFMVPMHAEKRKGALHEPTHPRPLPGGEQAFVRVASVPLLGGVRGGFMIPRHEEKRMPAFEVGCWMLDVGCFPFNS